jgi:hypothetical protein
MKAAWLSHNVIGTPPVQIDPMKEASAEKAWAEIGATDGRRIAHEHNGTDFATNIARNAKDFPVMPIPYWAQKITVQAATAEESEAKADKQAKDQNAAIAKGGGNNGNGGGKPAPKAEITIGADE